MLDLEGLPPTQAKFTIKNPVIDSGYHCINEQAKHLIDNKNKEATFLAVGRILAPNIPLLYADQHFR